MTDVDNFVAVSGRKVLVASRLFGFSILEVISYAAGLTKISFRDYFFITVVFSAPPSIFFAFFFRDTDFTKPANILLWAGSLIITGLIFLLILRQYYSRKSNSKN